MDLLNARISKDIESSIPIKDGLLRRARAGQHDKRTVRVVLDIDNMESYKIFHLSPPCTSCVSFEPPWLLPGRQWSDGE